MGPPQTQTPRVAERTVALAHLHSGWHRELYAILEDVSALVSKRNFSSASKRFGELRRTFERHLHEEDEFVLPHCTRLGEAGVQTGRLLRDQHTRLGDLVGQLSSALTAWQSQESSALCGQLLSGLEEHHHAEEALLSRLEASGPVGQ